MRWYGRVPCRVVGVEAPRRSGAPCGSAMTALGSLGAAALVADGPWARFRRWISAPHRNGVQATSSARIIAHTHKLRTARKLTHCTGEKKDGEGMRAAPQLHQAKPRLRIPAVMRARNAARARPLRTLVLSQVRKHDAASSTRSAGKYDLQHHSSTTQTVHSEESCKVHRRRRAQKRCGCIRRRKTSYPGGFPSTTT